MARCFDFNFAQHRRRREIRTPCIRGMRVTVGMIVETLAAGRTIEQVLFDSPIWKRRTFGRRSPSPPRLAQGHEIRLAS